MDRIGTSGESLPGIRATRIPGGRGAATRVLFQHGAVGVKVETSPVTRGVVFAPQTKRVSAAVEDEFGFAETTLVSFEDLYAGKLHAALDRQHPRDLFDVALLYANEGVSDYLFRAFLVYVASSNRPPHELLNPNLLPWLPLKDLFDSEFAGMTFKPVTLSQLEQVRTQLIGDIQSRLTDNTALFLRTLIDGQPDFNAIGLPAAAELPAVQWKLKHVRILRDNNSAKHARQSAGLEALLC